jgi:hypothetical protein
MSDPNANPLKGSPDRVKTRSSSQKKNPPANELTNPLTSNLPISEHDGSNKKLPYVSPPKSSTHTSNYLKSLLTSPKYSSPSSPNRGTLQQHQREEDERKEHLESSAQKKIQRDSVNKSNSQAQPIPLEETKNENENENKDSAAEPVGPQELISTVQDIKTQVSTLQAQCLSNLHKDIEKIKKDLQAEEEASRGGGIKKELLEHEEKDRRQEEEEASRGGGIKKELLERWDLCQNRIETVISNATEAQTLTLSTKIDSIKLNDALSRLLTTQTDALSQKIESLMKNTQNSIKSSLDEMMIAASNLKRQDSETPFNKAFNKAEMDGLRKELTILKGELKTSNAQLTEMTTQLHTRERQLQDAEATLTKQSQTLEDYNLQIVKLTQEIENQDHEKVQMIKDHDQQIAELAEKIQILSNPHQDTSFLTTDFEELNLGNQFKGSRTQQQQRPSGYYTGKPQDTSSMLAPKGTWPPVRYSSYNNPVTAGGSVGEASQRFPQSFITGGGEGNRPNTQQSFITGGGQGNRSNTQQSFIGGGEGNRSFNVKASGELRGTFMEIKRKVEPSQELKDSKAQVKDPTKDYQKGKDGKEGSDPKDPK